MTNNQINQAIGDGGAEFARQRIQQLQAERDEARAELRRLHGLIDTLVLPVAWWDSTVDIDKTEAGQDLHNAAERVLREAMKKEAGNVLE